MYSIYKITSPSGRIYIGQSKNIESRKLNYTWTGEQTKRQPFLHKSLVKYGFKNHFFEVLITNLTKDEANIEEIKLIKEFKDKNISLNCTNGGSDVSNNIRTPIIKLSLKGDYIKEYPSIIDAANELNIIHQKISIALSKKRYYSSGFLWVKKDEYEKGFVPSWNMKNSSRIKKVLQYDKSLNLLNEFSCPKEASLHANIKKQSILACLCGQSKTSGGFIWKYKN
jgi:hypothetical protein